MNKLLYVATASLLAAIVSPIVTSSVGRGAPTTADGLRSLGMAASTYANDFDGMIVPTQAGVNGSDSPWSVLVQPYLPVPSQTQTSFFDPARAAVATPTATVLGANQPWYALTSLSINDTGYSGKITTANGACGGTQTGYVFGARSLSSVSDPTLRVAFAPTLYGGTPYGWSFFRGYEASQYKTNVPANQFSWNNLVYATRNLYVSPLIPVVHVDGGAGKLNPTSDFKDGTNATGPDCSWLSGPAGQVWGQYWNSN